MGICIAIMRHTQSTLNILGVVYDRVIVIDADCYLIAISVNDLN